MAFGVSIQRSTPKAGKKPPRPSTVRHTLPVLVPSLAQTTITRGRFSAEMEDCLGGEETLA